MCFVGCAPTKQARSVETSGFLGDLYPMMRKGVDGEALLIYKSAKVCYRSSRNLSTRVLLDHAEIWGPPTTDGKRQKEAQHVRISSIASSIFSLSKDYDMVAEPGPGTCAFRRRSREPIRPMWCYVPSPRFPHQ